MAAANAQDNVVKALSYVEKKVQNIELVQQAATSTGLRPAYVAVAGGLAALGFLFFGFGAGFVVNLVGVAYPAYASFKAIETKDTSEDDTQWLTYWVCFAFFTLLEVFVEYILYFVPFYFALKLAFIVWLQLPQTRGAVYVYDHIIMPFLLSKEKQIDSTLHRATKSGMEFLGEATSAVVSTTKDAINSDAGRAVVQQVVTASVSGDSSMPTAEVTEVDTTVVAPVVDANADADEPAPVAAPAVPAAGADEDKIE